MLSILLELERCVSSFHLIQVQIKRKIWPGFQWQSGINSGFRSNKQGIWVRFMCLPWNIMSLKTEPGFSTSHWHNVSMTHLLNVPLVSDCSSCFLWLHTIKHLLNKQLVILEAEWTQSVPESLKQCTKEGKRNLPAWLEEKLILPWLSSLWFPSPASFCQSPC